MISPFGLLTFGRHLPHPTEHCVCVWRQGETRAWIVIFILASFQPTSFRGPSTHLFRPETGCVGRELEALAGQWTNGRERAALSILICISPADCKVFCYKEQHPIQKLAGLQHLWLLRSALEICHSSSAMGYRTPQSNERDKACLPHEHPCRIKESGVRSRTCNVAMMSSSIT